ncbi:MAG: alpha/beta-hydrolase family protein, partial [Lacipirellulaceae bacterium]
PLESAYPFTVLLIALVFGALLVGGARLFGKSCAYVIEKINRVFPRRVSNVLGISLVSALGLLFVNGVLAKSALSVADSVFSRIDAKVDAGIEQPERNVLSGSTDSLILWNTIGRQGKDFISKGPTQEQLSDFLGKPAKQPVRVYVGLRSRDTPEERAELALEELKRVGAFERSLLVVATPTGTGWLDPGATDTIEYLHAGDTAIVSMQYSYLPSWITIMVDPNRSRVAAQVLFEEVYEHWKNLPKEARPKLYLHGLSLGSLGSETSGDLLTTFEDPIQGALWSGPPFPSRVWSQLTRAREPNSPAWLPVFRDASVVRFINQKSKPDPSSESWSSIRCIYIQHASDPMIFFSPSLLYQKPEWLVGERGADVSPYLDWYPIITFLQVACDLPMATSVPIGYGHNYSPSEYLDAWIAITNPKDWDDADSVRLKQLLTP